VGYAITNRETKHLTENYVTLFVLNQLTMRTLNISISDIEYTKFGIRTEKLNFTEFVELVSRELMRQNIDKCLELAEKYGISKMTMDEITNEVKAVRQNAKNSY
jgi:predicted ATP-dependent endonuclease of OLD family